MTTRELLAEHAVLLNRHGADSPEVEAFVAAHRDDAEFVDLARVARELKAALAQGQTGAGGCNRGGLVAMWRQVWRTFLRGWRKVFRPYHCKECGRPLRRLRLRDLTPGQVALHMKGGTLPDLLGYGYHCPRRCEGPDRVVVIM